MDEHSHRIESVLISDDIDDVCVRELSFNGIKVQVDSKLSPDQLKEKIKDFDALIVRSATKVTKDVIGSGKRLKLIGRAGTGVDNIDLDAATKAGMIVMNTPMGNSRSAAELTCAMILGLSRRVPQADQSMKLGKWDRKGFMGSEVFGKTLAIIGLGRIGQEVAHRMQAFGMKTIGFDPIILEQESQKFGVKWSPLDKIWDEADYITVHVPLIPQTENLINSAIFEKCKKGVFVINCARGGIINEADLLEALNSGKCGGAGLDVFVQEPPKDYALMKHKNVIATPHLGASTVEAQQRVALEIAEQIVAYNRKDKLLGAVNGKAIVAAFNPDVNKILRCIIHGSRLFKGLLKNPSGAFVHLDVPASVSNFHENSLVAACAVGYLQDESKEKINLVNANIHMKSTDFKVEVKYDSSLHDYVKISAKSSQNSPTKFVTVCDSPAGPLLTGVEGVPLGDCVLMSGTIAVYEISKQKLSTFLPNLIGKSLSVCRALENEQTQLIVARFCKEFNVKSAAIDNCEPLCCVKFA